ncbi:MAG: NUDIX hydrolase [Cyclobacteriaceae bacterium]
MIQNTLPDLIKQVRSLAQTGLHYQKDPYDQERYKELSDISLQMLSLVMDQPVANLESAFPETDGYITPNVDVRAVVLNDKSELLMVKEAIDGKWSLPGGWADIGYTPKEVAVKEVREEAGFTVKATRLLALMDKKCHEHPVDVYYVYKIFILCEESGPRLDSHHETTEVRFFPIGDLPELSLPRNNQNQIRMVYDRAIDTGLAVYVD